MKNILLLLCAILTMSCSNDDGSEIEKEIKVKHDLPPEHYTGEWASISNTHKVALSLKDGVLTIDLKEKYNLFYNITLKDFETIYASNRAYAIYYNGQRIVLCNGIDEYEKYLTLTIDNKCISRMQKYIKQPDQTQIF